jgi:hypothetical protein
VAASPSHKFGQIIGDLLEAMLYPLLKTIADKHGLYLDHKHPRPARGKKRKVCWEDDKGNCHDLDYVLEYGGSEDQIGTPKAFIETAWRRYTKHSRNKAQEMQGAIVPLAEKHCEKHPFLGVLLAGVFTEGSIQQLRSHGFSILYFPYDSIISAFSKVGVDAAFDEETPDSDLQQKVDAYQALSERRKQRITDAIAVAHKQDIASFLKSLEISLNRTVQRVFVTTLHGAFKEVASVEDAIKLIERYEETQTVAGFVRYEISVRYSNGDRIDGEFEDKQKALGFLASLLGLKGS